MPYFSFVIEERSYGSEVLGILKVLIVSLVEPKCPLYVYVTAYLIMINKWYEKGHIQIIILGKYCYGGDSLKNHK